mmetsp:Transcript_32939/g.79390  ORF Transcript_32939/g.79390 Transcript_32939/m.79390 type:complete len:173 (+) Transcript_32939:63-581(+)
MAEKKEAQTENRPSLVAGAKEMAATAQQHIEEGVAAAQERRQEKKAGDSAGSECKQHGAACRAHSEPTLATKVGAKAGELAAKAEEVASGNKSKQEAGAPRTVAGAGGYGNKAAGAPMKLETQHDRRPQKKGMKEKAKDTGVRLQHKLGDAVAGAKEKMSKDKPRPRAWREN